MEKELLRVGKVVAAHGLNGAVILTHVLEDHEWLQTGTAIFISKHAGSFVPHFIREVLVTKSGEATLLLEEITEREQALLLRGKEVFVNKKLLEKAAEDSPLAWIGFQVQDEVMGNLGVLDDVFQSGKQWLGKLIIKDAEVLLPLVPDLLLEVDVVNKTLHTAMPEGLIEVYTG